MDIEETQVLETWIFPYVTLDGWSKVWPGFFSEGRIKYQALGNALEFGACPGPIC